MLSRSLCWEVQCDNYRVLLLLIISKLDYVIVFGTACKIRAHHTPTYQEHTEPLRIEQVRQVCVCVCVCFAELRICIEVVCDHKYRLRFTAVCVCVCVCVFQLKTTLLFKEKSKLNMMSGGHIIESEVMIRCWEGGAPLQVSVLQRQSGTGEALQHIR